MMFERKERCINCKNLEARDICYFCGINYAEIKHPNLMGGSDKCECYEKYEKINPKPEFEYPKKGDYSKCQKCGGKYREWSSDDSSQRLIEMQEKDVTFENAKQLISEMEKQGFEITSFGHIYKFKKKKA